MSKTTTPIQIPAPRAGEKYLCSIITSDGRICHTFLMPERAKKNWRDGMQWAKDLGGDLMDRAEQAIAYRDMPEEFGKEAHWSNTQHADDSSYAWFQHFSYGNQNFNRKIDELDVRAVRREFSSLVV